MIDSPGFRSGLRRLLYPAIIHTLSIEAEKSESLGEILQRLALRPDDCQTVPTSQRTFVGRYVDVATGEVIVDHTDIEIPGVIPFRWSRLWRSTHAVTEAFGNGWRHSYDFLLLEDRRSRQVVIRLPDHRGLIFPLLAEGEHFFNRSEKLYLHRDSDGYYLQEKEGLYHRFALNPSGSLCRLVSVGKRGVSYQIRFSYSSSGQLRRISDDFQRTIEVIFDAQNRISRLDMVPPNQPLKRQILVTYRYDDAHDLKEVIVPNLATAQYHYRQHRLIRVSDAFRQNTYFSYEKKGNYYVYIELKGEKDQDKRLIRYLLDEGLTQVTDASGGIRQYVHEGGVVHRFMSAGGRQRVWFYSEYGELLSEQDALGNTSFFTYDDQGNMTQASWPDGGTVQMQYNETGQLTGLTDRADGFWQWTYDETDRLLMCIDPTGGETTFSYDETGLPVTMIQADGQQIQWTYDAFANRQTQSDTRGNQYVWAYDFLGQLITDPSEQPTKTNTRQTAALYQPTYDTDGQLIRLRRTNRLNWQFIRDAAGRVREYTRADGCSNTFHYDAAGRLTEVLFSDGSWHHYAYRPDGWLIEAATPTHHVQFERDALGRITAEKTNQDAIQTQYDQAGRKTSGQAPDQTTMQYGYDADGQLSHLQHPAWQSWFTYDRSGRLTEQLMPGGLRSRWQYDIGPLPTRHQLFWGGNLQAPRTQMYSWEQQRLTRLQDSQFGTVTLHYDAFGDVIEANNMANWTDRWTADRSQYQSLLLKPATETIELGWQMITAGVARFYYDADGYLREKRVSGQVWQYEWHESGVLAQVICPDNRRITFVYDALGRRIEKKVDDYHVRWVWNARRLVHEWHQSPGSDPIQLTWFYAHTEQPTLLQLGRRYYSLLCNNLGQPLSLHDEQGEPVWQWQWCLFGKKHNLAGPRHWFTYLGPNQFDDSEAGLVYAHFRYYDAATGLPLSPGYSSPAGWARVGWEPPHAPESYLSAARYIRAY